MAKIKTEEINYNNLNGERASYKRNIYCNADGVFYCNLPKDIETTCESLYPQYFAYLKKGSDRKLYGKDLSELLNRFNEVRDSYNKYTQNVTYVIIYTLSYFGNIKHNGSYEVVKNTDDGSWLEGTSEPGFWGDDGLGLNLHAGVFKKIETKFVNIDKVTYEYQYVSDDDEEVQQIRYEIPRPTCIKEGKYNALTEPFEDELPYSIELVEFFDLIGLRLSEIIIKLSMLNTKKESFKNLVSKNITNTNLLSFIGLNN